MPKVNLQLATRLAGCAFAAGVERKVFNMPCVVTDAGGHVRLAMRADGQGIFGIATATDGRFVPLGGGVVIADDEDETIGAVGVSGGAAAIDDEIVRAALQACGLHCRK